MQRHVVKDFLSNINSKSQNTGVKKKSIYAKHSGQFNSPYSKPPPLETWVRNYLQQSPGWLKGEELAHTPEGIYPYTDQDPALYAAQSYTTSEKRIIDMFTMKCTCPRFGLCGHIIGAAHFIYGEKLTGPWNALAYLFYMRELCQKRSPSMTSDLLELTQAFCLKVESDRSKLQTVIYAVVYIVMGQIARDLKTSNVLNNAATPEETKPPCGPSEDSKLTTIDPQGITYLRIYNCVQNLDIASLTALMAEGHSTRYTLARAFIDRWRSLESSSSSLDSNIDNAISLYRTYVKNIQPNESWLSPREFWSCMFHNAIEFDSNTENRLHSQASVADDGDNPQSWPRMIGPIEINIALTKYMTELCPVLLERLTLGISLENTHFSPVDSKLDFDANHIEQFCYSLARCEVRRLEQINLSAHDLKCLFSSLGYLDDYTLRMMLVRLPLCWQCHGSMNILHERLDSIYADCLKLVVRSYLHLSDSYTLQYAPPKADFAESVPDRVLPVQIDTTPAQETAHSVVSPLSSLDCREIIENIRREEFGLFPDSIGTSPLKLSDRKRLTRAIGRIAEEIYASQTRVFWELTQNADDCEYGPGVTPTMFIAGSMADEGVLIATNELGFTESHVRAICDIARSTKEEDDSKTGKFGMGFKSVFLVTNEPMIFSRGFKFGFIGGHENDMDAEGLVCSKFSGPQCKALPYCCPYWIENDLHHIVPANILQKIPSEDHYTTFIWLPKSEQDSGKALGLKQLIDSVSKVDIDELIFLDTIRRITFINSQDQSAARTLTWSATTDHVLCKNGNAKLKSFELISTPSVDEEFKNLQYLILRRDTLETAFRVNPDLNNAEKLLAEAHGKIFCTLPVCASGLKFHINSRSFKMTGSREKLKNDSPVNYQILTHLEALICCDLLSLYDSVSDAASILPLRASLCDSKLLDERIWAIANRLTALFTLKSIHGDDRPARDLVKLSLIDDSSWAAESVFESFKQLWPGGQSFDLIDPSEIHKLDNVLSIREISIDQLSQVLCYSRGDVRNFKLILNVVSNMKFCWANKLDLESLSAPIKKLIVDPQNDDHVTFGPTEVKSLDQAACPIIVLTNANDCTDPGLLPLPFERVLVRSHVLDHLDIYILDAMDGLTELKNTAILKLLTERLRLPAIDISDAEYSLSSFMHLLLKPLCKPLKHGSTSQMYINIVNAMIRLGCSNMLLAGEIKWIDALGGDYRKGNRLWSGGLARCDSSDPATRLSDDYEFDLETIGLLNIVPAFENHRELTEDDLSIIDNFPISLLQEEETVLCKWFCVIKALDESYKLLPDVPAQQRVLASIIQTCVSFNIPELDELLQRWSATIIDGVVIPLYNMYYTPHLTLNDFMTETAVADEYADRSYLSHFPVYSHALLDLLRKNAVVAIKLCLRSEPSIKDFVNYLENCAANESGLEDWQKGAVQLGEFLSSGKADPKEVDKTALSDVLVRDIHGNIRRRQCNLVCLQYPRWFEEFTQTVPGLFCDASISGLAPIKKVLIELTHCVEQPNATWAIETLNMIKRILTKRPPIPGSSTSGARHEAILNTILACHWVLRESDVDRNAIVSKTLDGVPWIPIRSLNLSDEIVEYCDANSCKNYIFGFGPDFEDWLRMVKIPESTLGFLVDCWVQRSIVNNPPFDNEETDFMKIWDSIAFATFADLIGSCLAARWWATAIRKELASSNYVTLDDRKDILNQICDQTLSPRRLQVHIVKDSAVRIKCSVRLLPKSRIRYELEMGEEVVIVDRGHDEVISVCIPQKAIDNLRDLEAADITDVSQIARSLLCTRKTLYQISAHLLTPKSPDIEFVERVVFSCKVWLASTDKDSRSRLHVPNSSSAARSLAGESLSHETTKSASEFVTTMDRAPWDLPPVSAKDSVDERDIQTPKKRMKEYHRKVSSQSACHDEESSLHRSENTILKKVNNVKLPKSGSAARNKITGLKGEQLVHSALEEELAGTNFVAEWVNQKDESLLPYDIVILDSEKNPAFYVEVKSSCRDDWSFFLSSREFLFAARERQRYFVFCVNNMGRAPCLRRFRDPYQLLLDRQMQLMCIPT